MPWPANAMITSSSGPTSWSQRGIMVTMLVRVGRCSTLAASWVMSRTLSRLTPPQAPVKVSYRSFISLTQYFSDPRPCSSSYSFTPMRMAHRRLLSWACWADATLAGPGASLGSALVAVAGRCTVSADSEDRPCSGRGAGVGALAAVLVGGDGFCAPAAAGLGRGSEAAGGRGATSLFVAISG